MIFTLPITLTTNSPFQKILSPFIACLYAAITKEPALSAVNIVGNKSHHLPFDEKRKLINRHTEFCQHIGIANMKIWSDDDPQFKVFVQSVLSDLRNRGLLTEQNTSVASCRCGAVEMLSCVAKVNTNAKTYTIAGNGDIVCKLCNHPTRQQVVNSLILKLQHTNEQIGFSIYPNWIRQESDHITKKLSGMEILISRHNRPSSPLVESSSGLSIDTDFFWSLFLAYLTKDFPENPVTLITSNRTLGQALRVVEISRLVGCKQLMSLIVNPTFSLMNRNKEPVSMSLGEFCELANPEILRYLLTLSLRWNSKESIVDQSKIYWISHSIRPKASPLIKASNNGGHSTDQEMFLKICNSITTNELITNLRKNISLNDMQRVLYGLLHHTQA